MNKNKKNNNNNKKKMEMKRKIYKNEKLLMKTHKNDIHT